MLSFFLIMYVVKAESGLRSTDNKLLLYLIFVVFLGIPITVPPPGKFA